MKVAKRILALSALILFLSHITFCPQVLVFGGQRYQLLIIGPEAYKNQIERFMVFKESLGLSSRFASIEYINSIFEGLEIAVKIHEFVADEYRRSGISYLLLVGDYKQVPAKYVYSPSYEEGFADFNYKPTDWYYGVPNWSESQTGLLSGNIPEIAVGRLPVKNVSELENYISKIVNVESEVRQGLFIVYSSLGVTVNPTLDLQYAYFKGDAEIKPLTQVLKGEVAYAITYTHGDPSGLWVKSEEGVWKAIMSCGDVEAFEASYNIHFLAACFTGALDLQSESLGRVMAVSPRGPALVIASSRTQTCDDPIISYFWKNYFETGDVGKSILKAIKEYLSDGRIFSIEKPKFQKYNLYLSKVVYGDISWRVKNPMATLSSNFSFKTINETEVLNFSHIAVWDGNLQPISSAVFYPLILFICFAFKRLVQRVLRSLKACRMF
ncbi:MAG: C25 family cysteine peptidase [Candidatus Bathyarchaeia archaeon]